MTSLPVFSEPLHITAVDGEVAITGPDGLCASLTPDAAVTSARRLLQAAEQILGHDPSEDVYQKPLG